MIKPIRNIIILFSIILSSINLYSREDQMGINFSSLSGCGLVYHTQINKNYEIEAGGFLYYLNDGKSYDYDRCYLFGAELQRNLFETHHNRIYLLLPLSFWYVETERPQSIKINDKDVLFPFKTINRVWNTGLGLGYEHTIADIVKLGVSFGLQYQISDKTNISNWIDRSPDGTSYLGYGGGISLRIIF